MPEIGEGSRYHNDLSNNVGYLPGLAAVNK